MSFRSRSLPVQREEQAISDWKKRSKKVREDISEAEKIGVTVPSELFGGFAGTIPGLATTASQIQPAVEQIESFARPEFLPSSGLEAAPEKGLSNLLALIGKIPGIEKFTPEQLRKQFEESTEGKFKPQSLLGRGLARGGSLAGQALGLGGGGLVNLARITTGGLVGQTLREKGAPEALATGVEILSPALLASLSKKLPLSADEEALASLAKRIGINDKQTAAILKSPKAQSTFARYAAKGERAENLVSSMFDNLGENYQNLKKAGREEGFIRGDTLDNLLTKWEKTLTDLQQTHRPSPDKAAAIEFMKDTINDVASKGSNVEKLVNLYQDINRSVNWNAWSGGKKQLAALKEPIKEAIMKASPEIGKEFTQTNDLYKRSIHLAKILKPTELEKILGHGHAGEMALAIATFNPGLLNKFLGFLGGRQLSREMLFSPRFNKMHTKMLGAIKTNKSASINQILKEFEKEIKKSFPEESQEFEIPEY